jgi:hypothetical protein
MDEISRKHIHFRSSPPSQKTSNGLDIKRPQSEIWFKSSARSLFDVITIRPREVKLWAFIVRGRTTKFSKSFNLLRGSRAITSRHSNKVFMDP